MLQIPKTEGKTPPYMGYMEQTLLVVMYYDAVQAIYFHQAHALPVYMSNQYKCPEQNLHPICGQSLLVNV